jgi:hypothetical protein
MIRKTADLRPLLAANPRLDQDLRLGKIPPFLKTSHLDQVWHATHN